jgi:2,4-dienoyl-CoA reductase-like NADH-dependent reductase (Old Yellow Enzyme family)
MSAKAASDSPKSHYPNLFSPLRLGPVTVKNRVVFAPTYSSWTTDPFNGIISDMGKAYWAERARGGVGLVTIGATTVHSSGRASSSAFPQLYDDRNVGPLSGVVDAIHAAGAKVGVQLYHGGLRNPPLLQQHPGADPDAPWHSVAPSEMALGEMPGSGTAKELDEDEIRSIVDSYGAAAARAIEAGVDGVEFHLAHGYLAHQFLSPFYNKRTDRWGGTLENRLRFSVEALRSMREAVGDRGYVGYRISAETFWDHDMGLEETVEAVAALRDQVETDYVSVSIGIHHSWIHSPMWFEGGWEREYAAAIREVSRAPVMMVGRITSPETAEELLASEHTDAICLARQMFADPEWANKAAEGRAEDIRPCVGANQCWRGVGLTLQCVYNPTIGREAQWGADSWDPVADPKRVLIVGSGPAGLEYARVAATLGHDVTVLEQRPNPGGHVLLESLLPKRRVYGQMTEWLAAQAVKNGADLRLSTTVAPDEIEDLLRAETPDHVVLATGATWRRDGFQAFTGNPIPGWETGNCISWTDALTDTSDGPFLVLDDAAGIIAPLIALHLRARGPVRLVTRWPMVGMDTLPSMYFDWIIKELYEANIELTVDHFVEQIDHDQLKLYNVRSNETGPTTTANTIVMVTSRTSDHHLKTALHNTGHNHETIGDATAPRSAFEAVYEAHRQARKL